MNSRLMRIGLLLMLGAGIAVAVVYRDRLDVAALERWIQEAGIWGPLLFMAVYAVAAVLFLPGTLLTLAGGALFGPVLGTFYNLTGATIGATLAFLIARYLASDWVADKSGGRLKQLINGVESEGWRFVAFTRLVPLFPFNLLNYALGLTRIKLSHYLLATYICMLPGAMAYSYLGYAGREAVSGGEGLIQKVLLALALLAVVAFLPRLISKMRRDLMVGTASDPERGGRRTRRQGGDDEL
ncbi:MAG: TVP38/TMEM64 family protein [Thiogranum sp.]